MRSDQGETIFVTVAYADSSEDQRECKLELQSPVTAKDAIEQSGILEAYPSLDISRCDVGIYSQSVSLDCTLKHLDRVEIYRPLIINPKDARRLRAQKKKS